MSYQCIAEGANGLIYYNFSRFLRDDKNFVEHWTYVRSVVREIASVMPVFLLNPGPKPVLYDNTRMSVRTWSDGGSTWVLAVNDTRNPLVAEVRFSSAVGAVAETAFGDPPTTSGDALSVNMPPLGCILTRLEP